MYVCIYIYIYIYIKIYLCASLPLLTNPAYRSVSAYFVGLSHRNISKYCLTNQMPVKQQQQQ